MSNPLINMMARQANGNMPGMQMLQQFQQFKNMWTPQAAQQKLNEMLQTGQINGQQLEQAKQMAQQMQRFFKWVHPPWSATRRADKSIWRECTWII